jgi:small subunit ribosomal protein S16
LAVKIRLRRLGRKKRPFYRIIAADSRASRDGRFIEEIGYYNPLTDPMTIVIQDERVMYWLENGAIPTPTVKNLLQKKGIILRFDLKKRGMEEDKIEEEMKKWELLQVEREKRMAADTEKKLKAAEKEKAEKEMAAAEAGKETAKAESKVQEKTSKAEVKVAEEKTDAEETIPSEEKPTTEQTEATVETEKPGEDKKTSSSEKSVVESEKETKSEEIKHEEANTEDSETDEDKKEEKS